MNPINIRTFVTLVAVVSLMASGCSGISFAAAPTLSPTTPQQTPTITSMPTEPTTVQKPAKAEVLSLTQDELVGAWFNGSYIEFRSGGLYLVYASLDAFQAGDQLDDGQYGLQGDQVWLGPQSRYCDGMGFYQLTSKSENELEFTKIREECSRWLGKLQRVIP